MPGENRPIRSVRAALQGVGKYRGHNSLIDLAESLLQRWPKEHYNREAHRHAQLICYECFEGRRPAEDARDAFILALDEAGISIVIDDRLPRYPVPPVAEPTAKKRRPKATGDEPSP
ncbi:DUF982 domain-containing protein [Rhizobium mongolense]|uniref:DUF982 domain-containing protein n=1 Tax=Rhizobium mongolense TaxID=57676 RepID=UPI0034A10373